MAYLDLNGLERFKAKNDLAYASAEERVPTNVRQAILALFESAAYAETGLTDEIAIVESWASEVTSLSLSANTLTLNGDTPQTLVATVIPSSATVAWSSSDTEVATVTGGVVTGASNGTCVITASAGTKSATCSVTVSGFATLESISAVYTQSGTVYDTDSLDDLKADLVVTATYSDTSTETVPSADYVLSGTLAVGTSTITVTYQGKTTTFNVTVTAKMLLKLSDGDFLIKGGALSWDSTGPYEMFTNPTQANKRRHTYKDDGVKPYYTTSDDQTWTVTNPPEYPIRIPANATGVTCTITPSTQYLWASLLSYDDNNNTYNREISSNWQQGTYTTSFTAGSVQYLTIATKYNNAGTSYPTEPSEITIQYAE